jgi:hypothetical protein
MKNKSLVLSTAILLVFTLIGVGCAKIDKFDDTNVNPNGISSPIPSALLTSVQSQLGGLANPTRTTTYCQYTSENQYTDISLFQLPQIEMGPLFAGNTPVGATTTPGPLNDLQVIINFNSDPKTAGVAAGYGSNADQIAIAKILKSYIFWIITDRWGDIPYSEALQGATTPSPKFDKQEDIYFGMMKDLKDAVAGFDGGGKVLGDLIYDGDVSKWKKLGNSLRMLMALRLTKVYPNAGDKAAVQFAEATGNPAGIISSNADNFVLKFPGGSFKNTWYLAYESRDDYAESKTIGDVLQGLGDARQSAYGTNTTTFPYGLTRDLAVQFANSVGNGQSRMLAASKRTESSPVVIVNAATVLLAKAEAIERGWITGDAQTQYESGIAASFQEWGVTLPPSYLSGPANYTAGGGVAGNIGAAPAPYDAYNASNAQDAATLTKLQRISLQYWLAAYPNGNEGWANWRRTGMPNLKGTRFATSASKQIVRRYVYGVNDYSFNNEQTKAAAARLTGGDVQDAHIWWDK